MAETTSAVAIRHDQVAPRDLEPRPFLFGEVRTTAVERDADQQRRWSWKHEGHLVLDAEPPEEFVVEAQAMKARLAQEVGDLERAAVPRPRVVVRG
jgi:hypothetical protein